jgi:choline dehydrogenase
MRSGIGPEDHLKTLGIEVLVDLAGVGKNLVDHPLFQISFEAKPPDQTEEAPLFQTLLTLKSSEAPCHHDLQVLPMSIFPSDIGNNSNSADFNMLVSLLKPCSRGCLRLRSSNPKAPPVIDLGYFTHPKDIPRMIEVVRAARRIVKTPPLSRLLRHEMFPGSRVSSDSGLESAIRAAVGTYHHPVGTCRMGSAGDNEAVVDSQGRVQGVDGLSVIDASIMPTIPAANTNLPTIMVAECCSEWLK